MKFLRHINVSSDRVNKSKRISVVNYSWSAIKTFQEYLDFHDIIQLKTGHFAESPGPLLACFCVYVFICHIGWYIRPPIAYFLIHACFHSKNIY